MKNTITTETPKVRSLFRVINRQAKLSNEMASLAARQMDLENEILGDDIPDWKKGEDLREELAYSVVDGNEMTMDDLLSILNRAKKQIDGED